MKGNILNLRWILDEVEYLKLEMNIQYEMYTEIQGLNKVQLRYYKQKTNFVKMIRYSI